jgi:hypothetical protein
MVTQPTGTGIPTTILSKGVCDPWLLISVQQAVPVSDSIGGSAETKWNDGAVLRRFLVAAATAWGVVYLVVYLWVIDAQEGAIGGWYVVLIVLAALSFALAALDRWARPALTVGLVTSALAMLVGLLSLGAQWQRLSSRH